MFATLRPLACGALAAALLLGGTPRPAAPDSGPGPGRPVGPRPGQKDWQLYDKAVRIQARMWWHLSPEGVLVYEHRPNASPAELSHDATLLSDVAIWTGCYAASQACRWHVTRDPDALEQCRVLARGMALLSDVTGHPGGLARNVGVPLPGGPVGEKVECSGRPDGLWFRGDVSRDQLAGITLGWAVLARFVPEDAEVQALARRHMGAIARRLRDHGMWLHDAHGGKTKHGELRADVEHLPFVRNGPLASIGLAAVFAGAALDGGQDLRDAVKRLRKKGWDNAISEQHTWLRSLTTTSNVNMSFLALLTLAMYGEPGREGLAQRARRGIGALRAATVGWWNGGYCACGLLGGLDDERPSLLAELRATLHDMSEAEIPPGDLLRVFRLDRPATIVEKGVTDWTWKDDVRIQRVYGPPPGEPPTIQYTRADWLFAYWLARAAGYLQPLGGPGANPTAHHVSVQLPPWREAPSAVPTKGP